MCASIRTIPNVCIYQNYSYCVHISELFLLCAYIRTIPNVYLRMWVSFLEFSIFPSTGSSFSGLLSSAVNFRGILNAQRVHETPLGVLK